MPAAAPSRWRSAINTWTIRTAVQKAQLPVHTFVLVDIDNEELCNACEREQPAGATGG